MIEDRTPKRHMRLDRPPGWLCKAIYHAYLNAIDKTDNILPVSGCIAASIECLEHIGIASDLYRGRWEIAYRNYRMVEKGGRPLCAEVSAALNELFTLLGVYRQDEVGDPWALIKRYVDQKGE